jgi:hypothetical protein
MMQFRFSRIAVLVAAIGFAAAPELTNIAANTAFAQEAMRPEVGRIVQAAGDLYRRKNIKKLWRKSMRLMASAVNPSTKVSLLNVCVYRLHLLQAITMQRSVLLKQSLLRTSCLLKISCK